MTTEASLRGRYAAHIMHSRNTPEAITRQARATFLSKFEREADPDGTLDPAERARRAYHLRQAHFLRLAYLSAKARRERAQRKNG